MRMNVSGEIRVPERDAVFAPWKQDEGIHGVASADAFDYIERVYNPRPRHSTIGYLSPMEFERLALLA